MWERWDIFLLSIGVNHTSWWLHSKHHEVIRVFNIIICLSILSEVFLVLVTSRHQHFDFFLISFLSYNLFIGVHSSEWIDCWLNLEMNAAGILGVVILLLAQDVACSWCETFLGLWHRALNDCIFTDGCLEDLSVAGYIVGLVEPWGGSSWARESNLVVKVHHCLLGGSWWLEQMLGFCILIIPGEEACLLSVLLNVIHDLSWWLMNME